MVVQRLQYFCLPVKSFNSIGQGVFVKWHHPESSRLMTEQGRAG